ncbi:MAG: hypothetical protein H6826_14460 [Planctomycetes bacterium]|nr:hypothetical protein [Planctomycetota bacterium]
MTTPKPKPRRRSRSESRSLNTNRPLPKATRVCLCNAHMARLMAGVNVEGRCDLCDWRRIARKLRTRLKRIESGEIDFADMQLTATECLKLLDEAPENAT